MVLNNTCQCNACANITDLDLKFFVHYGTFTLQHLGDHKELLGSDVNLIHRLLKNHVTEETACRAYTLYTDAAIQQLGLADFLQTMTPHTETYEHLGRVRTHIQDMHPVWETKKDQTRIEIPLGERLAHEEAEFPIGAHRMWEIVTDPSYRALFMDSISQKIHNRQNGRLGLGSAYECFHGGNRVTMQTILEWQPFQQMTTEDTTPVPGATCLINIRLTPTGTGTRVALTCSKARGPWLNRTLCNLVGRAIVPAQFQQGMQRFAARLEEEQAQGKHAALSGEQI
jgi:hypothetical protein